MFLVSEAVAARVVGAIDAIDVIEQAFSLMHRGHAEIFPVVMGRGSDPIDLFSVKSGVIHGSGVIGVKVGSYWPGNRAIGQRAHASTTLLLDPATGLPRALIAASYLTALRTAASDGVAIKHLSRPESDSVALVGAGHQAWFDLAAACAVRSIRRVRIWSRQSADAESFAQRVRTEMGIEDCRSCNLADAVGTADIVITATAAREPLVQREWVRPGTHISAMGSDAIGKHELAIDLVAKARLFADSVEQSVTLGDFEKACQSGQIDRRAVVPIGAVINGAAPGRLSAEDITIYDSSGIALQDLAIGAFALEAAVSHDLAEQTGFLDPAPGHNSRVDPLPA